MATKRFSDAWLRGLKPADDGQRDEWLDEAEIGLAVSVNSKRRVTFWLISRFPNEDGSLGNPSRRVLGDYRPADAKDRIFVTKRGVAVLTLDQARHKAREWKSEIAAGRDPGRPAVARSSETLVDTMTTVFADYFRRHVRKEGQKDARGNPTPPLRSAAEIQRTFDRYIFANLDGEDRWRDRAISTITRRDVTKLLDEVQDESGAVQADAVLAQLSSLFNWFASRGDDFVSPIVRGMRRSKPAERKRKRVLGDSRELGCEPIMERRRATANRCSFGRRL